jgi:hypothetical protein
VDRRASGRIRIRLRIELFNERAALFAALRPHPPVYVNVAKKKSLFVARYTCCGEYDNEEQFSLRVLLAYVDELKGGYLRRILYSIDDAGQSLIFWRGQVKFGPVWLPLYSLLIFCTGILLVERPQLIPAFCCLGIAGLMLVNMHARRNSPSPWHRCFSFGHYLKVMLLGGASRELKGISAGEGWEEQKTINEVKKKRFADDDSFFQKKEALEKQIQIVESISIDTKSKAAVIPVELLVILGKLQGIVGGFVRLCRSFDVVIKWESSDLAFWITAGFLCIGIVFLFIPWAFLLKWAGRCSVVVFLGPQNKLIDMIVAKKESDERRIRLMLGERMFRARCRQEEAAKLKAFRHVLYGKLSTAVPTIIWTSHVDLPLPESYANILDPSTADEGCTRSTELTDDTPYIPGQKLYGLMVPRPRDEWLLNAELSRQAKDRAAVVISEFDNNPSPLLRSAATLDEDSEWLGEHEGVEVTDSGFAESGSIPPGVLRRKRESLQGDWGVEVVDLYDEEAQFVRNSSSKSAQDFPYDVNCYELSGEERSLEGMQEEISNTGSTVVAKKHSAEGAERGSNSARENKEEDDNWEGNTFESHPAAKATVVVLQDGGCVLRNQRIRMENSSAQIDAEPIDLFDEIADMADSSTEQGFEPVDMFEDEADFVDHLCSGDNLNEQRRMEESSEELGVEAVDLFDDEVDFVKNSCSGDSI